MLNAQFGLRQLFYIEGMTGLVSINSNGDRTLGTGGMSLWAYEPGSTAYTPFMTIGGKVSKVGHYPVVQFVTLQSSFVE